MYRTPSNSSQYGRASTVIVLMFCVMFGLAWVFFRRLNAAHPIIEISSSLPLRSTLGEQVFNGASLALDERRSDFPGAIVIFSVKDDSAGDSWSGPILKRNLQSFIGNPNTLAFFGPLHSTAAKIAIPILNRAGIPMISPTNSLPSLTKEGFALGEPSIFYPTGKRNYVRFSQTDDIGLSEAALWAKALGVRKVVVIDDHTIDYPSILTLMRDFHESPRIEAERITEETDDAPELIAKKISDAKPDLIYYLGISPQNFKPFAAALRLIKYSGRLMSGFSTASVIDVVKNKEQLEGMLVIGSNISITASSSRGTIFAKKYKARYGEDPILILAGTSYESMNILLDAILKSSRARKSVLTELTRTRDKATMFGSVSFDEHGDSSLHYTSRLVLHDGQFIPFTTSGTPPANQIPRGGKTP